MSAYDPIVFANWLNDAFSSSPYKSFSALAEAAKLQRSTVSALANAKEQTLTGKASKPKRETVVALAVALGRDPDTALILAGHAPEKRIEIAESIAIIGIDGADIDPADLAAMKNFITYTIEKNKKK